MENPLTAAQDRYDDREGILLGNRRSRLADASFRRDPDSVIP
jgi:hypothetical protein